MNTSKNQRAFVVKVRYGLSNRLSTISEAFAWSRIFRRKLAVIWEPEDACGCRLNDLFIGGIQPIADFVPSNESFKCYDGLHREYKSNPAMAHAIESQNVNPMDLLKNTNIFIQAFFLNIRSNGRIDLFNKVLVGRLFSQVFKAQQRKFLLNLVLQDEIRERCLNLATNDLTGMHIRVVDDGAPQVDFPDYAKKFKGDGYERFLYVLDRFFEKNGNERIFLTCNSVEFQSRVLEKFDGKILFYPKRSLDRKNKIAIQDALIDLILLSRTKRIIGTRYSSFSKLASIWGNVPIQVI